MSTRKEYRQELKRQGKKKKIILWSLFTVVTLLAVLVLKVWWELRTTADQIYDEVSTTQYRPSQVDLGGDHPVSILLIGTDTPINGDVTEPARSDTLIVVTINPKKKQTTMVSIPRDSYARIVGYPGGNAPDTVEKITHAYAYGEAEMTINSVQEFLQIPIDYYVRVNMQGLNDLVDALGGIEVTSPLTFTYTEGILYDHIRFVEGQTRTINGIEALAFARMRNEDPEGDAGRQKRQRMVIEALVKKLLSLNGVANYQQILSSLSTNVRTNLSFDNMMFIATSYSDTLRNVQQQSLQMFPFELNGISLMYVSDKERLRTSNLLRDELELSHTELVNFYDPIADEGLLYLIPDYNESSSEATSGSEEE